MSKSTSKDHSQPSPNNDSQQSPNQKNPILKNVFTCGGCAKSYQSKQSLYTHCKKKHGGVYPENSMHNGQIFIDETKPKGRPKNINDNPHDVKEKEISKVENELLLFLGNLPKSQKEILIMTVDNPLEQLKKAINLLKDTKENEIDEWFLEKLEKLNNTVSEYDLPKFFDPIDKTVYEGKLDSSRIASIYNFLINDQNYESSESLIYKIIIVWLSRILSEHLLKDVIYLIAQFSSQSCSFNEGQYIKANSTAKFEQKIQNIKEALEREPSNLTALLENEI